MTLPTIKTQEYEDSYGGTYPNVEEAHTHWSTGCGEELTEEDEMYSVNEDGEPNYCTQHSMCDFCREELQKIERDLQAAREKENAVRRERFNIAKEEFIRRAKSIYPDIDIEELEELLNENYRHNGLISSTIAGDIYGEGETVFDLEDEKIRSLIKLLRISHNRHKNTCYDELLAHGADREVAREMIRW